MSLPTDPEILEVLDRLQHSIADDLEAHNLEFKPWNGPKEDMRIAVEYAACLANGDGGVIVFGVTDRVRGRERGTHRRYRLKSPS